jgi:hypothetical protein
LNNEVFPLRQISSGLYKLFGDAFFMFVWHRLTIYDARAKRSPRIRWQLDGVVYAHSRPAISSSHLPDGHCAPLRHYYASECASLFCVLTTAGTSGQWAIDFYRDDNLKIINIG